MIVFLLGTLAMSAFVFGWMLGASDALNNAIHDYCPDCGGEVRCRHE